MSKGTYSYSNRHRMHENLVPNLGTKKGTKMSTKMDAEIEKMFADAKPLTETDLKAFGEKNREIMESPSFEAGVLEDEVANLKGIIKELKRILSTCMYALQENEELMKDKERLDWLIDHAYIQFYKVDDGGEWEMELDASDARNHIDKEMEDAK